MLILNPWFWKAPQVPNLQRHHRRNGEVCCAGNRPPGNDPAWGKYLASPCSIARPPSVWTQLGNILFLQPGEESKISNHHLPSANYQQLAPLPVNSCFVAVLELTMCLKVNLTVFSCVALLIHDLHTRGIWGNNKTVSLRSSVIQWRPEYSESPNFAENCSILTLPCKMLWNGNSQPLLTHQLQRINSNRKQGHHYPAPLTSPEKTLCSCASLKC